MLKVLIIDDDEIVLLVESKILQRCGIAKAPLTFSSGPQALEYLQHEKENDTENFIILLDINMPGMSGWEVLEKFEQLKMTNNYFVIMVTSSIDIYDKEIALKYKNVIAFVEKPITTLNCNDIKSLPAIKHLFKSS